MPSGMTFITKSENFFVEAREKTAFPSIRESRYKFLLTERHSLYPPVSAVTILAYSHRKVQNL